MRKLVNAIKNLFIGLITTAKHLPRKEVTIQYPDERWPMPERSRGIVVLLSDKETGELNCTTCLLCERACPSAAIKIVYEKDEKKKRHLKDFIVDNSLCCFCGLCEEACNFAALKMAGKYEFATWNKEDLIWHTDKLQEIGRDVPYEARKKRKPKQASPAPPAPASPASPAQAPPAVPKQAPPAPPAPPSADTEKAAEPKVEQASPETAPDPPEEKKPEVEGKTEIENKPDEVALENKDNKDEQGDK